MFLTVVAESSHVSFKVMACKETAWTKRALTRIRISFFAFFLFRNYSFFSVSISFIAHQTAGNLDISLTSNALDLKQFS
jgi:hypothetical protein